MQENTTKRKPIKTSFAIPFTQFDWGDYYADTDYLTFKEHGIYWNLLRRYYTTGPFPQDLNDLKRKMRYTDGSDSELIGVLEEFFYISEEDNCWHQKRCDEEIMRAKGVSEIQSKRARKGAAQKKRSLNGQFVANDLLPATAGQSPAIKEEDVIVKSNKQDIEEDLKTRLIQDEEQEVIERLRSKYEDEYKDMSNIEFKEKKIEFRVKHALDEWRENRAIKI